jgi:CYTH domain-containing protein
MATGGSGQRGLEIERRYLLAGAPSAAELARLGALPRRLEQVYLRREDDWVRRVRKIEEAGTTRYVATRKRDLPATPGGTPGIAREEIETDLTVRDYGRLVADADPERRVIRKTRHVIAWKRWTLELDVFSQPPGLVMLEVELDDPADVPELPAELAGRVVREVTDDPTYTNYGLSLPADDPSGDLLRG